MTVQPARQSLSVIIPVYNSAAILPDLAKQLIQILPTLADCFEIIMINDASKDESWQTISALAAEHSCIRGFNMMRNYGQHNALLCGIRAAQHDLIVTMDDDLQHPPGEIHKLLEKLHEGFDVVYGTPQKEQHGLLRDLASRMTKLALSSAMGTETAAKASAFRAFRTPVRTAFSDYKSPFASLDVLLTWGTTKFSYVNVRHEPRKTGESNYTFIKLITHAFNMMTGFSVLPLQLASMLGFACACFGVIILVYVITRYLLLGYSAPGFPFLASIISIFSGVQLLSIGIIGEYLARMHFRMMERPLFVVRDTTG